MCIRDRYQAEYARRTWGKSFIQHYQDIGFLGPWVSFAHAVWLDEEDLQLIAASGVNVQPGQEVFIAADLDQPEFVKMLVEECYKRKAKKVVVDWSYQPLQKLHYRYRTLTTLSKLDNYEEARWQHYVDTIPCRIYLLSEDPDGLKGINQEKMAKSQQRLYPVIKKYRDQIENKYQWCIAAVPGAASVSYTHLDVYKRQVCRSICFVYY